MIITIGGRIGSGKTTLAAKLADALGYPQFDMGKMFRDMAKEQGLSIEKFYAGLSKNPDLEKSIDQRQVNIIEENDNVIIQGRTSFFFAEESGKPAIKVFLTVDPRIAAQRKIDKGEYPGKTPDDVITLHRERENEERSHYRALYHIEDHFDPGHYDIVVDTSNLTESEVLQIVLEKIKS